MGRELTSEPKATRGRARVMWLGRKHQPHAFGPPFLSLRFPLMFSPGSRPRTEKTWEAKGAQRARKGGTTADGRLDLPKH